MPPNPVEGWLLDHTAKLSHDLNRFPSCALNTKQVRSQSLEYSSPARLATCDPMSDCETRKAPGVLSHDVTELRHFDFRGMDTVHDRNHCDLDKVDMKNIGNIFCTKDLIRIKILQNGPPAPQSGCRVTASYAWPRMSLRTRSYWTAAVLKLQSVLGSRFHFMEWELNKIEKFLLFVSFHLWFEFPAM